MLVLPLALSGTPGTARAKDMIEYFQPTPMVGALTSSAWGGSGVRPRDIQNGLDWVDAYATGSIRVDEITSSTVRGGITMHFNADNDVSGEFSAEVCAE